MEWESLNKIERDHPRIISVKFGEIPPSSLGGDAGDKQAGGQID